MGGVNGGDEDRRMGRLWEIGVEEERKMGRDKEKDGMVAMA